MNNSTLFKQAHKLTKQVIKDGDSYQTTFGLCLKQIKADYKKQTEQQKKENVFFTSITMFLMLAVLAVACNVGYVAVIAVYIAVITLASYSLKAELKTLFRKIKSVLGQYNGMDILLSIVFSSLFACFIGLFMVMVTR